MAAPFLKWAGGKSRLVPTIAASLPCQVRHFYEPFTGGGAVFFGLQSRSLIRNGTINDLNSGLAEAYVVVRDAVRGLIHELEPLAAAYLSRDYPDRSELYYRVRASLPETALGRVARLIFLNRTCFNGLYRVNRSGQFNVPHGDYTNPRILDIAGLTAASAALRSAEVTNIDFEELCERPQKGDFVYLDPPYQPLSATANFTSYTENSFTQADQQRLAACVRRMSGRGVDVMVSNSSHPFVEDLYEGLFVSRVKMGRAINSAGDGRSAIDELLITTWDTHPLLQVESKEEPQPDLQIA